MEGAPLLGGDPGLTRDGGNLGMPQIAGAWRVKIDYKGMDPRHRLRVVFNDTTVLLEASNGETADFITCSADVAGITIRPGDRIQTFVYVDDAAEELPQYRNLQICFTPARWSNRSSDHRFSGLRLGLMTQPSQGSTAPIGAVGINNRRIYPDYNYLAGRYRVRFHYTNSAGPGGTSTARAYHWSRKFVADSATYTNAPLDDFRFEDCGRLEVGSAQTLDQGDGYCVFDDLAAAISASGDSIQVEVANAVGEAVTVDGLEICFDVEP